MGKLYQSIIIFFLFAVNAYAADPLAVRVRNVPAGNISATNVQDAIDELDTEKLSSYTETDPLAIHLDGTSTTTADIPFALGIDAAGHAAIGDNISISSQIVLGVGETHDLTSNTFSNIQSQPAITTTGDTTNFFNAILANNTLTTAHNLTSTVGHWGVNNNFIKLGTGTVTLYGGSKSGISHLQGTATEINGFRTELTNVATVDNYKELYLKGVVSGSDPTAFYGIYQEDASALNYFAAPVSIPSLYNLTSNGFVKTSGGNGTLSVDTSTYLTAETDPIVGAVTGLVKSDGAGNISAITDSSTNWDTAYTHSQDNSQAHSDYLLNNASDDFTGQYLTLESSSSPNGLVINNTAATADPQITFQLSGTSKYSIGVDDSASDVFNISASGTLGTSTLASASTLGWNFPILGEFASSVSISKSNLYFGPTSLEKNGATPDVTKGTSFTTANTGATNVTRFTNPKDDQIIYIRGNDGGLATFVDGTYIKNPGGANITLQDESMLTYMISSGVAYCISYSVN